MMCTKAEVLLPSCGRREVLIRAACPTAIVEERLSAPADFALPVVSRLRVVSASPPSDGSGEYVHVHMQSMFLSTGGCT
eukprot:scaffold707_cov240-Pinguiococcus_pyrenoidosus.AAC.14